MGHPSVIGPPRYAALSNVDRGETLMRWLWSRCRDLLLLATMALPGHAQAFYRLMFPEAAQHYVRVEAHYATGGQAEIELFLPVWTPGDYQIRNFSQQVDQLGAAGKDGRPLRLQALSNGRWRVDCAGHTEITLVYRVKGQKELSISSNYVDRDKAVLQGAATFISPVKPVQPGFEVRLELPPGWKSIHTGLPPVPDRGEGCFLARDFDQLVDCPIVAGSTHHQEFRVAGVRHVLVYLGQAPARLWDGARAARDVQTLVEATHRMWGFLPFAQYPPGGYWFLNLLGAGTCGLEHKNSTCIGWSPGVQANRESHYKHWLTVVSHEYFHTWNGKNLRPVTLGPFDYEARNITPSLWIVEGLTTYYSRLLLVRSGLVTAADYLQNLSADITRVERLHLISLTEASLQAWNPNFKQASNYTGGAVVGFLLDQQVRQATGGRASLDDVMRQAYRQYSGEHGYTEEQFEAIASQVAGIDLSDFFRHYVHGTEPLNLAPALRYYGLRWRSDTPQWKQLEIDPEASPECRAHWEAYLQGSPGSAF